MEKQKVYVVLRYYRGMDWDDTTLDSIWSRQEDAKRRIDDLVNECVRNQWYEQGCNFEYFKCKAEWAEDGLLVKMYVNPYERESYYIKECELDPSLPDFEGP